VRHEEFVELGRFDGGLQALSFIRICEEFSKLG
jgi:hypothetical protein